MSRRSKIHLKKKKSPTENQRGSSRAQSVRARLFWRFHFNLHFPSAISTASRKRRCIHNISHIRAVIAVFPGIRDAVGMRTPKEFTIAAVRDSSVLLSDCTRA